MKTTGTSSENWRLRPVSVSTSTSRQRKPPRRSSLVSFSFTISQRWHPLREYTITSRRRDMAGSLASRKGFCHSYLHPFGQFFGCRQGGPGRKVQFFLVEEPCRITPPSRCQERSR